jgi:hypothetical protein
MNEMSDADAVFSRRDFERAQRAEVAAAGTPVGLNNAFLG